MNNIVSIIVNTYNHEKYLKKCIDSALEQSYKNFELIVWDNGSTDNTVKIINEFNDKRIKYFYCNHTGQYQARNKALNIARGEFISFLDSDDYWLKHKLEKQINFLKDRDYDLCLSNFFFYNENKNKFIKAYFFPKKEGFVINDLTKNYKACLSTLCFKSDIIKNNNINFIEKFKIISDKDFILNLSLFGKLKRIHEPLAVYRIHDHNIGQNKDLEISELEEWIDGIKNQNIKRNFSNRQIEHLSNKLYYLKTLNNFKKNNLKNFFLNLFKINSLYLKIRVLMKIIFKK